MIKIFFKRFLIIYIFNLFRLQSFFSFTILSFQKMKKNSGLLFIISIKIIFLQDILGKGTERSISKKFENEILLVPKRPRL